MKALTHVFLRFGWVCLCGITYTGWSEDTATIRISTNEPYQPGSATENLTLEAPPGDYIVETTSDFMAPWSETALVTILDGGTATVVLNRELQDSLFIRAVSTSLTNEVLFLTQEATFEPLIGCGSATSPSVLWTWSDDTTSTDYPVALKDFGSPGARWQKLIVDPLNPLTAVNLGYDAYPGGGSAIALRDPQKVLAVSYPRPLTRLKHWASSHNPLTNTLDFRGFANLEQVECYGCAGLQHVIVTNLPSVKRLNFYDCDLKELDISGNPNLDDIRCGFNAFTNIVVGRMTGPNLTHWGSINNPQLTQNLSDFMTNFYSLKHFYAWNDNQHGELSFVSTNLIDVRVNQNHYTRADFAGHKRLQILQLQDNELEHIELTGCSALSEFTAQSNQLGTEVLDNLLTFLDSSAPKLAHVNLSRNAGLPSPLGFMHYSNLVSRGVFVLVDWPESNDGLMDVAGGSDAITFVTTTQHPSLEVRTLTGAPVNLIWHWGDGTITTGALQVDHDFSESAVHTNYVQVTPAGALLYFGVPRNAPGQGIAAVYGLSSFTNLNYLYLYKESVTDMSIAGCASLRQLHLAENPVSEAVCDQWFIDLDSAVSGLVTGADFWYPAKKRTSASDAAWSSLAAKGYVMHPL